MTTAIDLLEALKRALKSAGYTYADVAKRLDLSEASVKRIFAKGDLSLSRLEAIAALVQMDLADLARLADEPGEPLTELTPDQEEALLANPKLLLVTYLALNQWPVRDIVHTFELTEVEVIGLLARLDRLGLLDLLPGNRVKLKTARNFRWRKDGPIQRFFEEQVRDEFMQSHFAGRDEALHFVGGLLSRASIQQVRRSLDKLAAEFDDLARADANLPVHDRESVAAVLGFRQWEFSLFTRLRRT